MGHTDESNRGVNPARLTDKQRRFVAEYVKHGNAATAALAAGYSKKTSQQQGSNLLKNPLVMLAIGKATKEVMVERKIEAGDVIKRLFFLLNRDVRKLVDDEGLPKPLHQLDEQEATCIDGFETDTYIDDEGFQHVKTKVKLSPIATAVDMALKHKGLYAAVESHLRIGIDWNSMFAPSDPENDPDPVENRLLELE